MYWVVTAVCGGARYGLDNPLSGHVNVELNWFGNGVSGCLGMFDVTFDCGAWGMNIDVRLGKVIDIGATITIKRTRYNFQRWGESPVSFTTEPRERCIHFPMSTMADNSTEYVLSPERWTIWSLSPGLRCLSMRTPRSKGRYGGYPMFCQVSSDLTDVIDRNTTPDITLRQNNIPIRLTALLRL